MRNIYSRSKFKKLYEDSSSVKDVTNTDGSPAELKQAWNTSLVGAITNGVVGGTIKTLDKIFKWGRRGWYRRNLLSKLNKEFLKAVIFFSDKNNVDLKTGNVIKQEEAPSQSEVQDDEIIETGDIDIEDVKSTLEKVKTLQELLVDEDIRAYHDLCKKVNREITEVNNYYDNYKDALENASKNKNTENIKYYQNLLDKVTKKKSLLEERKKVTDQIKELIDERLVELGGTPKDLDKENLGKIKLKVLKKKIDKLLPEGWEPKNEFDMQNVPDFIDYPTFKNMYDNGFPDPSKVEVGDKFTYYNNKGKRTIAVVRKELEVKKGNIPVTINNAPTLIPIAETFPENLPNFSKIKNYLKKNIGNNIDNYNNMSSEDRQKFLEITQSYKIISKMYDVLKTKMVATQVENEEGEKLFELQVGTTPVKLHSAGKAGNLTIGDVLTNKEISKLKSSGTTNMNVLDIAYGPISNTINDKFSKKDAAKEVNKYNLEVIKLVAEKVFETDKQKKNWQTRVNKVNSFWNDLLEINDVDILKGLTFGGVKPESINKNINDMSSSYSFSALNEVLLNDRIIINKISSGTNVVVLFGYQNLSYIVTGNGSDATLRGKIIIRVSSLLDSTEKDGKEMFSSKKFQESFTKNSGQVFIDGVNKTANAKEISSYIVFDRDQPGPQNIINKSRTANINIINRIVLDVGGGNKDVVICAFNEKKDNINIFGDGIKKIPEIKISLKYVATVKGDVEPTLWKETGLATLGKDYLANDTQKIQQQIEKINMKKK